MLPILVGLLHLGSGGAVYGQSLGEALNATNLTWTTGGDAEWFSQTNVTHDGVSAAQSGLIVHDQSTWIETIVTGPGTLSFRWKVSSEPTYDYLQLSVNGEAWLDISGDTDWNQQGVSLPDGDHIIRWTYVKDGTVSAGTDAGWLDEISFAPGGLDEHFGEALNSPDLPWTSAGAVNWFSQTNVTHDGGAAAQSGLITDSQSTWVGTTVSGPGLLSFWWKASSEEHFDLLQFSINGLLQSEISGDTAWQQQSLELPAGNHTLRWAYVKDDSVSAGADAGWLDEVAFGPITPPEITSHPTGGTVNPGASFTFSVTATAHPSPDYQWRFNGAPLPGETGASLVLTNLQPEQAGSYDVLVTNVAGSVTSSPALLNVSSASPLAQPVLELHRTPSGLELAVAPDSDGGVLHIFRGLNMNSLLTAPDLILVTNMPQAEPLRVFVARTNAASFYRALRLPGD